MKTRENMGSGTTIVLGADDKLGDVPDSHQDIITPEIRRAFEDPISYFRAVAERCRFPRMAEWLNAVTESGRWRLLLEEGFMMDRCTQGGFFMASEDVSAALVAPPLDLKPTHDIAEFAHYYSLVDVVHWGSFACAGGLLGYGECYAVDDELESRTSVFPSIESFVWGNSPCGDDLIFTLDGRLGFLSHETEKAYSIGTIEEGVNWVFNEFLNGRTPEFDYGRT